MVHGDCVETETQNAIKSAEGECKSWLFGGLSEVLHLDLEIANSHNVLGHKTGQATRAIMNLKRGAVLLVC